MLHILPQLHNALASLPARPSTVVVGYESRETVRPAERKGTTTVLYK